MKWVEKKFLELKSHSWGAQFKSKQNNVRMNLQVKWTVNQFWFITSTSSSLLPSFFLTIPSYSRDSQNSILVFLSTALFRFHSMTLIFANFFFSLSRLNSIHTCTQTYQWPQKPHNQYSQWREVEVSKIRSRTKQVCHLKFHHKN